MATVEKYVICVNNHEYPGLLEIRKIYRAQVDDETEAKGDLLVIDDSGQVGRYPSRYFVGASVSRSLEDAFFRDGYHRQRP